MRGVLTKLRHRWYLVILLIVVVVVVLRVTHKKPVVQNFIHPSQEAIEETVDVSGTMDASRVASLKFITGGTLTALNVKEGDSVRKYQPIASLDARDIQKSLQESLNTYLITRTNFDDVNYNNKDQALTDTVRRLLQRNQYSLNASVYDVELKNIALSNASLYAPFDGVVTSVPVQVSGVQVLATDAFEIVDPNSLQFVGEVDEVDIGKVKLGQVVHVTLDAYPGEVIDARINDIAIKATPSTKSSGGTVFVVKAAIPNANLMHTRLGMNGSMKIVTNRADGVITIPIAATIGKNGNTYVNVADPSSKGKTIERQIQTGIESEDKIEVTNGLSLTDSVLLAN